MEYPVLLKNIRQVIGRRGGIRERIKKSLGIGIVAMWIVIKVEMRMEVVEIEEAKKRKRIKMRWDEDTS